jgi:hypothetical protein
LAAALARHAPECLLAEGWSVARTHAWLARSRQRLADSLAVREVVALPLANEPAVLLGLLLVLDLGCVALLVPEDAAPGEQRRLLLEAGGGRRLHMSGDGTPRLEGERRDSPWSESGVLLPTSGSTGLPKLVHRSEASMLAEAQRYVGRLGLASGQHVVILAPVAHAYALGWLVAAWSAACLVTPVPPTHLDRALRQLAAGADWVVVTPSLASLLARRRLPAGVERFSSLRVMAGAGPVDAELEDAFRARFGTGLWRNYGSSETGAVLMGEPDQPDGCVGTPPPGVAARIVDEGGAACAAGVLGRLQVSLEDGAWRDMGDLASRDERQRVSIHGRTSHSIRRGERFISPREIERAALQEPGVRAAHASGAPGRRTGDERVRLEVWPDAPDDFDPAGLRAALGRRLPADHLPDEVLVRGRLRRSAAGKLLSPAAYRLAEAESLLAAARAYKRAELLFALAETGVLDLLDGTRTPDALAAQLGLDPLALEVALEQAERLELVTTGRPAGAPLRAAGRRVLDLERQLARAWTTHERIAETLRGGLARRPAGDPAALRPAYADALHGDLARFRVRLGLRRLRAAPGTRLLEVSAGPGDYLLAATAHVPGAGGRLWQVGALHGPPHAALARVEQGPPGQGERFDACVIFNAIHWPAAARHLELLLACVGTAGALLVDDIFLGDDAASGEFALDWLTHGGLAFQTADELCERLGALGFSTEIAEVPGSAHAKHVIARRAPSGSGEP